MGKGKGREVQSALPVLDLDGMWEVEGYADAGKLAKWGKAKQTKDDRIWNNFC